MPFLAACACLPACASADCLSYIPESGGLAFPLEAGEGDVAGASDVVTVSYRAVDGLGRDVADSDRRGLPLTFQIGGPLTDPILEPAVRGLRPGGGQVVWIPADAGQDFGSIVPPRTDLTLTLRLLEVSPSRPLRRIPQGAATPPAAIRPGR